MEIKTHSSSSFLYTLSSMYTEPVNILLYTVNHHFITRKT